MSPKKVRQQNKTVTIYNSKTNIVGKKDKKNNLYEQSRNNTDNWEFHFKSNELEDVKSILKCEELGGIPLLIGASVIAKKDIAVNLIRHGYNINEADDHNMTPLYWAIKLKFLEMIQFFLSNKADPFLKPSQSDDIIFLALGSNSWDEQSFIILWTMLKTYAHFDINATNRNGVTMIHLAVRREWKNLLELLFSNDANINSSNPNGVTPLMIACYRNDYEIVLELLKHGASLKRRNSEGFTALCYALSSAIVKNLEPPFEVVDRIRCELSRTNYSLSNYLKDRFRILLNPLKKLNNQTSVEQMLKNIIDFIGRNVEDGFGLMWKEIDQSKLIKECLEKYIEEKDYIKLVLYILNTIILHKPSDILISDSLIDHGCLDECIKVFLKYKDDNIMTYNSFFPIIFSNVTQEKWLENNQITLEDCLDHFLKILPLIESPDEEIVKIQAFGEDLKLKLNLTPDSWESRMNTVEVVSSEVSTKSNPKKSKRRTKALKAKIAKVKTAELTERYNLYGKKAAASTDDTIQEEENDSFVCDGFDFTTAIKGVLSVLEDDDDKVESVNWKDSIRGNKDDKPWEKNTDLTLKYLEGILGVIVNKYKILWDHDSNYQHGLLDTTQGHGIELQQCFEKEQLRLIHKEFYTLTCNIQQLYYRDQGLSRKVLKQLENLLLTHSIRGATILDQVASIEIVEVNATLPYGCGLDFPRYIQDVVNGDLEEIPGIQINWVKKVVQKSCEVNAMGDCVCSEKHECFTSTLFHSASDSNNEIRPCCNKSCVQGPMPVIEDLKKTRWCSLVKSLEHMDDCQEFLNGRIRISNPQKRSIHLLSTNAKFPTLEIGLGLQNDPLAVRFVLRNDKNAKLLKEKIDPILKLRHKNILQYHLCEFDSLYLVIATPLCEYNLGQFVLKMKQRDMKICKIKMIRQLLTGLLFLHNQDVPIVHGNLKPSNVLIDAHGDVRVAEFGIHQALLQLSTLPESTIIWFSTETYKLYKENLPIKCTCASDIQAAGMLVHFALNDGTHPFGKHVDDILSNLEKASPKILSKDLELCDLLSWMLLGEPGERPTIHQVLSHIFFWSDSKKWRYIMTCAGINLCGAQLNVEKLHASLDKTAHKENIMSNCWVMTAKKKYPQAVFIDDNNDTASGLLKFIKFVIENNVVHEGDNAKSLSYFILTAFPHFALTLYRMIENTEWTDHVAFLGFHNVTDCYSLQ